MHALFIQWRSETSVFSAKAHHLRAMRQPCAWIHSDVHTQEHTPKCTNLRALLRSLAPLLLSLRCICMAPGARA